MFKKIEHFFDEIEYRVRKKLSHYPVLYAVIGGIGVILFWRGLWHLADDINLGSIISLVLGFFILLITGVFVSAFIGNRLIISGLIGEKKITQREEGEIQTEETQLKNLQSTLNRLEKQINHLDNDVHENNHSPKIQ